jgi:GAF domain-containing protein
LFANQAAIAIHNSRLFNESLRRRSELQVINEIGQTLTSGIRKKEDEILELIYSQTRRLMDADNMFIVLYDETEDQISYKLVMENGVRTQVGQGKWVSRRAGRRRTEAVIRTRRSLLHRTEAEARQWYIDVYGNKSAGQIPHCWLGVPMVVGERVLGVIAIRNLQQENVYDETDEQILSSIANQAAIALDNASLYYKTNQALKRRVQALNVLNKVGQTLTSGTRLKEDEILKLIYEQICGLTSTQNVYIALYDEVTKVIRFGPIVERDQRIRFESRKVDAEHYGKTEEIILTRRPILHRTRQESEVWYKLPEHQDFIGHVQASYLGVPMIIGERVLGVLAIYDWEREYAYDEQDLQLLSSMANQTAIAIDNARLFDLNAKKESR